jgi:hypothetical protein
MVFVDSISVKCKKILSMNEFTFQIIFLSVQVFFLRLCSVS